jgi:hypothetical protein
MEPLAVDLLLLRVLETPALRIVPGRVLMARVMQADGSGRGTLSIAGAVLEAALPKDVHAGQELRLVVRDVSGGRVLLSTADQPPVATPPAAAVPLPGGGDLRVSERDPSRGGGGAGAGAGAGEVHTLALSFDAPALGTFDFGFRLDSGSLQVAVTVASGEPLQLAAAAAESLRQALSENVAQPVSVTVKGRREPLDVYA